MRLHKLDVALVAAALIAMAPTVGATGMESYGMPSGMMGRQADKPVPPEGSESGKAFREGLEALRKNDLDAAASRFRASAQAAPTEPLPLLALAEVAMRRGDPAQAEAQIKQAMKIAPRSSLVRSAWAHFLAVKKDYRGALAVLDQAIEIDPGSSALHDQKGDIYASGLRDRTRAMAEYRAALSVDANDASAHYALGGLLAMAGSYADAKPELVRATELAPNNAVAWVALGAAYASLQDDAAAMAAYDTALKLVPTMPSALAGRGDVLAGQGNVDAAIDAYEQALKGDPRAAWILARLGTAQQRAERTAEAEKRYRAALEIDPREPVATNNLAYLLADEKRDLDEALRLATIAVESAPPPAETARDTLAWVRRARAELPAAAKILEPLAARTKDPGVVYHLGVVYAEMGRKQDAVVAFDKALKLAPTYKPAQEARRKLAGTPG